MDTLSPDPEMLKPVAMLHRGRLRDVVLLQAVEGDRKSVGHMLKVPPNSSLELLSSRVAAQAERLERLVHPQLPRFQRHLIREQTHWFLFEHVDGFPLDCLWPPIGIPSDWVAFWLAQILKVLEYLHHQDDMAGGFAPSDLVVTRQGLSLVDVGILEGVYPDASAFTRSPDKRAMMAPEERQVPRLTAAGDLYCAGAVAHWLATGKAPEEHTRPTVAQTQEELLIVRPEMVAQATEAIAKLTQFRREARFEQAREALDFLAPAVRSLSGQVPPLPNRPYQPESLQPAAPSVAPTWTTPRPIPGLAQPASPPAEVPVVAEQPSSETVAAVLKEVGDDVKWVFYARPLQGILVLVVAGVLIIGGLRVLRHRDQVAPATPIMTVGKGVVVVYDGVNWQKATALVHPGIFMAPPKEPTELSFGQTGKLQLGPGATCQLDESTSDGLTMDVLGGQVSIHMPTDMTGTVKVPGGRFLCPASAAVSITLSSKPQLVTAHVIEGEVSVTDAGGLHPVPAPAGATVRLGGQRQTPEVVAPSGSPPPSTDTSGQ